MSAFDNFSLADSKKVVSEVDKFLGFKCGQDTSVRQHFPANEQCVMEQGVAFALAQSSS